MHELVQFYLFDIIVLKRENPNKMGMNVFTCRVLSARLSHTLLRTECKSFFCGCQRQTPCCCSYCAGGCIYVYLSANHIPMKFSLWWDFNRITQSPKNITIFSLNLKEKKKLVFRARSFRCVFHFAIVWGLYTSSRFIRKFDWHILTIYKFDTWFYLCVRLFFILFCFSVDGEK